MDRYLETNISRASGLNANRSGETSDISMRNRSGSYSCDLDGLFAGATGYCAQSDDSDSMGVAYQKPPAQPLRRSACEAAVLNAKKEKFRTLGAGLQPNQVLIHPQSRRTFLINYEKSMKPPLDPVDVSVSYVESAAEIYLQTEKYMEWCQEIDKILQSIYDPLALDPGVVLPKEHIEYESACVARDQFGRWRRCKICQLDGSGVTLQAVDYGYTLPPMQPHEYFRLKILIDRNFLDYRPLTYFCRLARLGDLQPTPVETSLLKELLPVGSKMRGQFERLRQPWRVALTDPKTKKNFKDFFDFEMKKRFPVASPGNRAAEQMAATVASQPQPHQQQLPVKPWGDSFNQYPVHDIQMIFEGPEGARFYQSSDESEDEPGGFFVPNMKRIRKRQQCDVDNSEEKVHRSPHRVNDSVKERVMNWLETCEDEKIF